MESENYSQLLGNLNDALKRWANELSGKYGTNSGKLEFSEHVRIARANLEVKLVAGGHGNLVQLIDNSMTSLFYKGLGLNGACRDVKPPREVKSWDKVTFAEKCSRKDLPELVTARANVLRSELSVCDEQFAAIDREIRQADPLSGEADAYKPQSKPRLSPLKKRIVETVRKAGRRLTTDEIDSELSKSGKVPGTGTVGQYLAQLTSMGILTNRQDIDPKGYALPEWDLPI